jgi:hypothetical protein
MRVGYDDWWKRAISLIYNVLAKKENHFPVRILLLEILYKMRYISSMRTANQKTRNISYSIKVEFEYEIE